MPSNMEDSLSTVNDPISPEAFKPTTKASTPPRSKIPQPRLKSSNASGVNSNTSLSPTISATSNGTKALLQNEIEKSPEGEYTQARTTLTATKPSENRLPTKALTSSDSASAKSGGMGSSGNIRLNSGKIRSRQSGIPGLLSWATPSHGGITKSTSTNTHITPTLVNLVNGSNIRSNRSVSGVNVLIPVQTPRKVSPNPSGDSTDTNNYINRSPGKTVGYKGNRVAAPRGAVNHNPTTLQLDNINEKFLHLTSEIKKIKEKNGEEISNLHQELIRLTTEKSTSSFEIQQLRDHNNKIQEDLLQSERKYMMLESEAKEAIQQRDNNIESIKQEFFQIIKEKEQEFSQKEIQSQEKWVNEKTAANEKLMDDLNDIQGNYEALLQEAKKASDEKDERIKQLELEKVEFEQMKLNHTQTLKEISLKHHTEITDILAKTGAQTQQLQQILTTTKNEATKQIEILNTEITQLRESKAESEQKLLTSAEKINEITDSLTKTESQMQELQECLDTTKQNSTLQITTLNTELTQLRETKAQIEQKLLDSAKEMQEFTNMKTQEIRDSFEAELSKSKQQHSIEKQKLQNRVELLTKELSEVKDLLEKCQLSLDMERKTSIALKSSLTEVSASSASLESITASLKSRIDELQTELINKDSDSIHMRHLMVEAQAERDECKSRLFVEETLRRKLHNQIQDLKGKFRVFCRVRPADSNSADRGSNEVADILYPDEKVEGQEIHIYGPTSESAMGNVTTKVHPFSFDKVFTPKCDNEDVFLEISQLVQSALDGYNVCIFAYGQTGSGKTHTMSSHDGMIPRAVNQIFQTCETLKDKGWKYKLEGQFLEIYNENINDLLGKSSRSDKIVHEIRHDIKEQKTIITDLTTAVLDSPEKVIAILRQADNNRSVAATKSNERSSRSHSVFIVKIYGENQQTGEKCSGILNLVDLAGSERLSQSQATGERLKETQAINKSLSCLGDVINALGSAREGTHIPYRNSKLTYLLQYSLSGNSKTLMFVNVSPLKQHTNETINSLRFATKVSTTQIAPVRTVRGMSPSKNQG